MTTNQIEQLTQERDDALAKLAMMREAARKTVEMFAEEAIKSYIINGAAVIPDDLIAAINATQADVDAWKAALVKPYVDDVKLLRPFLIEAEEQITRRGDCVLLLPHLRIALEDTDREEYR